MSAKANGTKGWALEMALYNKWQNEKLYGLCAAIDDAERTRDRGMFFGSIHATLDHILMVDRVLWHFAMTGEPIKGFDPNGKLYDDFATLRQARAVFDDNAISEVRARPIAWLDEIIATYNQRLARERTFPRQFSLMQMFNHGTHHRSQVTAELHRMGIDYGNTDLPFNPLSQY
jgi:uncharacterized damage-inducible protein DinB